MVRLNRRLVLGQSEAKPHIRVHVAVRQMVNHLADGPAVGAIWRVELFLAEFLDGCTHFRGRMSQRMNPLMPVLGRDRGGRLVFANGVTKVGGFSSLHALLCTGIT